jgi:hypothetical protein
MTGSVIVVTGLPAAGTPTVARLLAERLPRSAHIRGDLFRRMIVGGRADPGTAPTQESAAQLWLRYRLSAAAADGYAAAGFTAVVQDVILGPDLPAYARLIRNRPCHLVVLCPRPDVVAAPHHALLDTPRAGLWLDTSDQTPAQTVAIIIQRLGLGEDGAWCPLEQEPTGPEPIGGHLVCWRCGTSWPHAAGI